MTIVICVILLFGLFGLRNLFLVLAKYDLNNVPFAWKIYAKFGSQKSKHLVSIKLVLSTRKGDQSIPHVSFVANHRSCTFVIFVRNWIIWFILPTYKFFEMINSVRIHSLSTTSEIIDLQSFRHLIFLT